MKLSEVGKLDEEEFRRLTGIKRETFNKMIEILKTKDEEKKQKGGKPNELKMEDRLLMTLEYWREYRTYFHIAQEFGISESTCYRNVKWIEEVLIEHPSFALPGRKALRQSEVVYKIIMIDATETPIERPKKNRSSSIQVRKNATHLYFDRLSTRKSGSG